MPAPTSPDVPEEQRSQAEVWLRYEDLCQDGRLTMQGMPHTLGEVFWRSVVAMRGIDRALHEHGVVPILTRLCTEGGEGPLSVNERLRADSRFQIARVDGDDGEVERLVLGVWVELSGPRASTYGPAPVGAGERIQAGRLFAEHVFTRLFAPSAAERKVTRLPAGALPELPEERYAWSPASALLELPEGAEPLDELRLDPQPFVFGLDHTDANQHVNSLVYPRLFAEAALRRLGEQGQRRPLLARHQETAFRKPCFAGQRARLALQCFGVGEERGAVAALWVEDEAEDRSLQKRLARAHAYGLVHFGD